MNKTNLSVVGLILLIGVILTLTFQFFHFIEHLLQVGAWIGGYQEKLYMSPIGMWCMEQLGLLLFPAETLDRQMLLGFEFLHLIGNGIFVIGIIFLFYFIPNKKVFWAFIVEFLHLLEHVSLTLSAFYVNKSLGVSTFFGADIEKWTLMTYRIWWHFIFNFIPSYLVVWAIFEWYKRYRMKQPQ